MEETLEKEILEEEKNSSKTIFESELFENVYGGLIDVSKGELRNEVRNILLEGMKKFVEGKTCNTEPINWEAVEIAYFAGVATALGGDVSRIAREKSLEEARTEIMKRVIRKDNFIGFDIYFDGDNKPTGAAIFPKEQYEDLLKRGQTLEEIIKQEKAVHDCQSVWLTDFVDWRDE